MKHDLPPAGPGTQTHAGERRNRKVCTPSAYSSDNLDVEARLRLVSEEMHDLPVSSPLNRFAIASAQPATRRKKWKDFPKWSKDESRT